MIAIKKTTLHFQLYGRAKICGSAIDDAVLCLENGVYVMVDAANKMDPPSVGNTAYSNYVRLVSIRRFSTETYANYENIFGAAFTKLNSNGESVSIPDTLAAWS